MQVTSSDPDSAFLAKVWKTAQQLRVPAAQSQGQEFRSQHPHNRQKPTGGRRQDR